MIAGLGTDIVEIERVEALILAGGTRFLDRWFTPAEQAYCQAKSRPASHFAARLAAKEAIAKALRWTWDGPIPWRGIEIVRLVDGPPAVRLDGQSRALAEARGITDVQVSLSHSRDHATAVAVAWSALSSSVPL